MCLNPNKKIVVSNGVDLPILNVYLAGRIAGNCIDKCIAWRKQIVEHYRNYEFDYETETYASYPIAFLDALNSKESDSIDLQGLKSRIPPNLIYDKDILSIEKADVIVANMDDYMEVGIENELSFSTTDIHNAIVCNDTTKIYSIICSLSKCIKNRRPNLGTIEEVGIARYLGKPVILIVPENQKEIFETHPFQKRASHIVTSVDELLENKWLEVLYKSIAGSNGYY